MQFNFKSFDSFLDGMGQKVRWRRSYSCTCVNPSSGAPDPKHLLCMGKGRIWSEPVDTVVGVASQSTVIKWAQLGQWESGDMILVVQQSSAMYGAAQYDRITMLNSTDVFSLPLVRGAPSERLIFPVEKVNRVFWLDPSDRNKIIEGGIPVVSGSGHLSWPGGYGEPPGGVTYSVTGTKYNDYFIFDSLISDRGQHSGMRLPKKVVARQFDLFSR